MIGINTDTFNFLTELERNNNRDWFSKNKSRYDSIRQSFIDFLQSLYPAMIELEPDLKGLDISKSVFRIYRDIRFSADKSPYKTNMGALFLNGGKR